MKPRKILRPKETWAKLGCGKTTFEKLYRFHRANDPFVPNTEIRRLKPVPLGERNIGFLEHEADDLIDALAELRDAPKVSTQTSPLFLTDSKPKRSSEDFDE
jgi:predicted DNA-binding transcriptional regulator AlpA